MVETFSNWGAQAEAEYKASTLRYTVPRFNLRYIETSMYNKSRFTTLLNICQGQLQKRSYQVVTPPTVFNFVTDNFEVILLWEYLQFAVANCFSYRKLDFIV